MVNIAIFASGSGSNAENIIQYFKETPEICFPLILSNNPKAFVLERAKKLGIKSVVFDKNDLLDGNKVLDFLREAKIDKIVLAGYLLRIPSNIVTAFPNSIINIHPALLPKFGGKGMYGDNVHKAVKESGEAESGITIHYVNKYYDEGNIIFQAKCLIDPTDTFEDIATKVHKLEYRYYPEVINNLWKEN